MRRALPHDITNALAASALVLETGLAGPEAIAAALATFDAPPHRLERAYATKSGLFEGKWLCAGKVCFTIDATIAPKLLFH